MINRLLALILIIILLPAFLAVALAIYIEDGSPVLFKQKRFGKNSELFDIYKFRSMKKNAPDVATHLLEKPESFLLQSGVVLRKLSLDELPNLINVMKGDMGFVGPRPALYNQYDLMALRIAVGVDALRPGITGWAQVNGRDEISIAEKVALEKEYLDRKSILFDLHIVLKTLTGVLRMKGVAH